MRLIQSVLATLPQIKKPQRQFVAHLLGLLLMLPGHATFRNLSRYSSYHERTFSRWYDQPFDSAALNKAAITQVIAPEHQQALVALHKKSLLHKKSESCTKSQFLTSSKTRT